MAASKVIKMIPDQSILKLQVGDTIALTLDQFEQLSSAFFEDLQRKFVQTQAQLASCAWLVRRRRRAKSLEGVPLTNLDQPLFDGAEATKRDLVDYLDGVSERIIPALANRALSVIRVHRGQDAFMQKNVPKYTPEWVQTVKLWSETSKRDVFYALCNDRRTLVWFANQRAIEYHPTLVLADRHDHATHLVLDLDPPAPDAFTMAVRAAHLVRQALTDAGLDGAVKTSGAKGCMCTCRWPMVCRSTMRPR